MEPLVSCILATHNRQPFLTQAIRYFRHQTYTNRELVIIDDGEHDCEEVVRNRSLRDLHIHYIKLDEYTPLGRKLNLGIAQSHGKIIQKLDDDDYYHPDFLNATVQTLLGQNPECSIVGFDCFLVLIAETGTLKFSGHGWCAGGTLCFFRELWQKQCYRDIPRAVDWWFLQDHAPQQFKITDPSLYILVRHQYGHLWNTLKQMDVTGYFRRQPCYPKSLRDCLTSEEDWLFYQRMIVPNRLISAATESERRRETQSPN
jgi:glycosyltransferase involved in cell wall biosynthesis